MLGTDGDRLQTGWWRGGGGNLTGSETGHIPIRTGVPRDAMEVGTFEVTLQVESETHVRKRAKWSRDEVVCRSRSLPTEDERKLGSLEVESFKTSANKH